MASPSKSSRPWRLVAPVLVAFGLCVGAAEACHVYGEDLLVLGEGGTPGGLPPGRGAGFWSGQGDQACLSVGHPTLQQRPTNTAPGEVPPITVAIRKIDLGTDDPVDGGPADDAFKTLGFDLDGLCTGRTGTCPQSGPPACAPLFSELPVDGDYCRDNGFGDLSTKLTYASQLTSQFGFSSGRFDCSLCAGYFNFLVRISGYNGESDDSAVEADFFPSPGLEARIPLDCTQPPPESACFKPFMRWKVDRNEIAGGDAQTGLSRVRSVDGYVRDGVVVLFLPDPFVLRFPGDTTLVRPFPVTLHGGYITGKLGRDPSGAWQVEDGMVAGAMRLDEVIDSLSSIGFCSSDPTYPIAVDMIRNVADLLSTGDIDPNRPCDAISVGIGFDAREATLGEAADPVVTPGCAADAGP